MLDDLLQHKIDKLKTRLLTAAPHDIEEHLEELDDLIEDIFQNGWEQGFKECEHLEEEDYR
jgi:hypothetical protein